MQLRHHLSLLTAALLTLAAGAAEAYPQYQFSTQGKRCSACHFSPSGGGRLTNFGRQQMGALAMFGGDGSFLHGAWEPPKYLALGFDARAMGGFNENNSAESDAAVFPMQADLYVRLKFGDVSAYVATGACCGARDEMRFPNEPEEPFLYYVREYQLMWQPKNIGPYVRAGRFFASFSHRLHDHTSYVRRDNGQYIGEETLTLSGGMVKRKWELHVSAFTPDFQIKARGEQYGGAVLYERRIGKGRKGSWGAHGKFDVETSDNNDVGTSKYTSGLLGKYYLEAAKVLVLAEADTIVERSRGGNNGGNNVPGRVQSLFHVGATFFVANGLMLGASAEIYDEDISIEKTERTQAKFDVQFPPYAHFELHAFAKYQRVSGGENRTDAFLMFHHFLYTPESRG